MYRVCITIYRVCIVYIRYTIHDTRGFRVYTITPFVWTVILVQRILQSSPVRKHVHVIDMWKNTIRIFN